MQPTSISGKGDLRASAVTLISFINPIPRSHPPQSSFQPLKPRSFDRSLTFTFANASARQHSKCRDSGCVFAPNMFDREQSFARCELAY